MSLDSINLSDLMNYKPKKLDIIKWRLRNIFDPIRRIPYRIKYFWQRGKRGWSDYDVWQADGYLAGVIADILEWYTSDRCVSVSMHYATDEDPWGINVDDMVERRNAEFTKHAAIFREYSKNGLANNKKWQDEFGGIMEKDMQKSLKWFATIYTGLWD